MITISCFLSNPAYFTHALTWLRKSRTNWPASDSVWHFLRDAQTELPAIRNALEQGTYQFEPVKKIIRGDNAPSWIWHSRDTFVLKALSLYLNEMVLSQFSPQCVHIQGNGGIHSAIRFLNKQVPSHTFVFRSDVKSYYESMEHTEILRLLHNITDCPLLHSFFENFLNHLEDNNCILTPTVKGISKGCPISPLLGALYLCELDRAMEHPPVAYVRYMDDWCILAKTKAVLRKAVKTTNQILSRLNVSKHPDKTFIGRISRGFDFLGFHFTEKGLFKVATITKQKMLLKLRKLYEHPRGTDATVVGYLKRWTSWVESVLRIAQISDNLSRIHVAS
ncbi:MAG: hypothetical protein K2Q33_03680 [Gammaproteobacteria bacterium]|nr:hypothetical protein [Gammaproteobacteria bacterium]